MAKHTTIETVTWGTRAYRVNNLKWGQEFSGGLPEAVSSTSGYSIWGGSCEIIPDYSTIQGGANPWSDGYPTPGEAITITVKMDDEIVGTYRPIVDKIDFTLDRANLSFVMRTDSFSRTLRLPPVMQAAPPVPVEFQWSEATSRSRYPAPTTLWTVAEAFRAAGYHLTPPVHRSTIIDLSMQGCVWTNPWRNLGETVQCESTADSQVRFPRIYGGEGILWMHHGIVYAVPSAEYDLRAGHRLSFLVHQRHSGYMDILLAAYPQYLWVVVDEKRNLWLMEGNPRTEITRILASEWAEATAVSVIVKPGQVTIAVGDVEKTVSTKVTSPFTGVRVNAKENAGIAGVQVDTLAYGAEHRILNFSRNARIKGGLFTSYMRVCLPSVRDRTARAVLNEVCEATLSSWWVDGDGIANFEDANSLAGAFPTHTVKPTDIGEYQISSELLSARSAVEVVYSETSRSASSKEAINLWSKGGTANAGDETEDFVEPGEDTEWIDPDFTFTRIASDISGFNTRSGSWWGVSKDGATYDNPSVWSSEYSFTSQRITPWLVKITERFGENASRKVHEYSGIPRSLRGVDTPILRGRGLITRFENRVTVDGGKANAPVLEIDAQKWVDRQDRAEEIAAFIMRYVADPPPLLQQVEIPYSPTMKLGQTVKINGYSSDGRHVLFGAILTCLIIGFTHSPDTGSTTLSLRVVAVDATARTWREIEAATRRAEITWAAAEKSIKDRRVTWSLFGNSPEDYGG